MPTKGELRPYTVCFTGHREIQHKDVPQRLDVLLEALIQQGYIYYGAGGALGFDTEAALSVLRLKEKNPHIKLILVLPFPEQAKTWTTAQQEEYERIKGLANKVRHTSEKYTRDCYHVRNRALVDHASLCVAYLTKPTGGTHYTVGYAHENGVRVINIAEEVIL